MTAGICRFWNGEEGWGVIDSDETPGGCWVHFSNLRMEGLRLLLAGVQVAFEWERADQDGFAYRATWAEVPYDALPPLVPNDPETQANMMATLRHSMLDAQRRWETERPRRVKLMADEDADWCLWTVSGLAMLGEDALPISDALKDRIKAWFNACDDPPRHPEWPNWVPPDGLDGDEEEQLWIAEGEALRSLIADELGPDYEVTFLA